MTKRYKVMTGPDGTYWVPLQPLLLDLDDLLKQEDNPEVVQTALSTVRTFIQSLIHEGMINDKLL